MQPFPGKRRKRESLRTKYNQISQPFTGNRRKRESLRKKKYNQITQPNPDNRRKREYLRTQTQSNHAAFPRQQEEEGIPPNKNTIKLRSLSSATRGRGKHNQITQPFPGNKRKRKTQSNHAAFPRQQEEEENTIKSRNLSQATRGRGNPPEQKD